MCSFDYYCFSGLFQSFDELVRHLCVGSYTLSALCLVLVHHCCSLVGSVDLLLKLLLSEAVMRFQLADRPSRGLVTVVALIYRLEQLDFLEKVVALFSDSSNRDQ